jgi:arylsulfatase A
MNLPGPILLPLMAACIACAAQPNIILILADDVGQEVLGCYGGESYRTPRLDRLASEGVRFEFAFSMPVCHPTRVTLLTGLYPVQLGNPKWGSFPVRFEKRTFANALKENGYATAVAGKWQLGLLGKDPQQPHRMGFDRYCLFGWHEGPRYWKPHIWQDGNLRKDVEDRYGPDVYCDFLIDFIREHRNGPFLACFPMALCHDVSDDFEPPPPYGPGKKRYENFAEMVGEMDRIVGRLLDGIDDLGLKENTLVIFTADNGTPVNPIIAEQNGKFLREKVVSRRNGMEALPGKGSLKDAGTRVPLILRLPSRVKEGSVIESTMVDCSQFHGALLGAADVAPLPRREAVEGLLGLPTAYSEGRGGYWVRSKRWKLYPEKGRIFDMQADPLELSPVGRRVLDRKAKETIDELEVSAAGIRKDGS